MRQASSVPSLLFGYTQQLARTESRLGYVLPDNLRETFILYVRALGMSILYSFLFSFIKQNEWTKSVPGSIFFHVDLWKASVLFFHSLPGHLGLFTGTFTITRLTFPSFLFSFTQQHFCTECKLGKFSFPMISEVCPACIAELTGHVGLLSYVSSPLAV